MFTAPVAPNTQADVIYSYYDFIEAESVSHLAPEDFKFLEFKGCFHLPTRPVLDELVREYFLHVHPMFPLIDERDFWDAYLSFGARSGQKKIPLFVFRAMLFVSSSFASDIVVQRLGFQKPIEARSCLYQRAKLLYQFGTSCDPFTLAQGSLILTYYSSEREPMANTSWLQLAIQYAEVAGVSDYANDMAISEHQRLARKRLWWCIVVRDRILPLGVRRCIQLTHDHFDCNQSRLSERDLEHEFDFSQVYDPATKADLARILTAQIDMAVGLTDVISLVYPASGYKALDRLDYNAMRAMGPRIDRAKQTFEACHTSFQSDIAGKMQARPHESVSLYLGLTQIYYQ